MAVTTGQFEFSEQLLKECILKSHSRLEFWSELTKSLGVQRMAEVGVYKGEFASLMLQHCEGLTRYYMIDPWKHLSDWNKPANELDAAFAQYFQEAITRTDFAAEKRVILRGRTIEVIDDIRDDELDFAYIDGDHTLRGITLDLIRVYPKVRTNGLLGGDDFCRSVWQHKTSFEPTLVFPFAVYFAEAVGATVYALPYSQFCLQKTQLPHFAFVDLTGQYDDVALQHQFTPGKLAKLMIAERFPGLKRAASRARRLLFR